jgi:hypothetical protein
LRADGRLLCLRRLATIALPPGSALGREGTLADEAKLPADPVMARRRSQGGRLFAAGAVAGGIAGGFVLLARGALTLDLGIGRHAQPLGPLSRRIEASPELVFDVIAEPYLGRTPRALEQKLQVWERGTDTVLAAHFTRVHGLVATTLEMVHFERPTRIGFRLVRGPVPHVAEAFELRLYAAGTELVWTGELGTDFWRLGRWWGRLVAKQWEKAVRASLSAITAEAERRAALKRRSPATALRANHNR